jgi:membrane fusion protein, multidrug efflux system
MRMPGNMAGRVSWKWLVSVSLLALSISGVGWFYAHAVRSRDLADPARARRDGRPIPVRTSVVTEIAGQQVIGGTSVTVASDTALVQTAPTRSRAQDPVTEVLIKSVAVKDGDHVKAGQLLFEIDDAVLRQIVRQREAELTAAERVLKARTDDLTHHQKLLDMSRQLSGRGLIPQAQLLEAESRSATVRASVDEARSRLNLLRADLAVARRDVERFRITSPIEGFVSGVDVVPGTVITQPTVLARVLKLDPIHVMMDFPQEQLGDISVGQTAVTVLDSFPQESFTGKVAQIMPEVKRDLRVLPVLISMPNPGVRLKAGISGFTRLNAGGRTALGVPATAVIEQGGKAMTFRVENGRARLREVRVGAVLENGWREVHDGLSRGDEVVVFHNFYRNVGKLTLANAYLQDNDLVDADWRKWTRRE